MVDDGRTDDGRTTDGRTTEHGYTISSPCEPDGSGELKTGSRITCPCNKYPINPHFYTVKMGLTGVYLFFLFLFQNIDCGYSLEPPRANILKLINFFQ